MKRFFLSAGNNQMEVTRDNEDDPNIVTIRGLAVPYDTPTRLFGNTWEQLYKNSIPSEVREDARLMISHDHSKTIASVPSGTMSLRQEDIGLILTAYIDIRDTDSSNLFIRLQRGDIGNMSIGFSMRDGIETLEEIETKEGVTKYMYSIERIGKLYEASALPFGAYPTTNIGLRNVNEIMPDSFSKHITSREDELNRMINTKNIRTVKNRINLTKTRIQTLT